MIAMLHHTLNPNSGSKLHMLHAASSESSKGEHVSFSLINNMVLRSAFGPKCANATS